mmetsp:Transcript_38255/g.80495  ORF Transcript_38255/g.80495 Transcript_38255/m.80495 type:complete len:924 (+) Transcript_38255:70-2841(+)|eukprot:CAMPEP_0183717630 /NCGR_PEP_ID=MMETSP0737-20130205/11192_1 /TAXON_ID=385413 /ORGANISM="Thalassiosira miniscula, Strain CCMP1093" /LENGTH=923 /DNA_ID=CAMNT_0025947103 /DNA_START=70 /DNA_END=2841 /DNA_ORIENTATION=-
MDATGVQPQTWDEATGDESKKETNGKNTDAADGPFIFEVEEDDFNIGKDDDFEDGFNLLTQSNALFKGDVSNGSDSSSEGLSDDSSESSSSGSENDNSSSEDDNNDATPLQERRERNMRRNEAFIKAMKLQLQGMNGTQPEKNLGSEISKQKNKSVNVQEKKRDSPKGDAGEGNIQRKRRGMIFSTPVNSKRQRNLDEADCTTTKSPLTTKSLVDELKPNYPHRANQIHILCSQLVNIVQKSKFAWQMSDNIRSWGNTQYSEASYQGETKLAAPSPILITGTGGTGKTCVVRDAMKALQKRNISGNIADAYVDCASSESGSVAAVMNSAYRQLYDCCVLSSSFGVDGKVEAKGITKAGKNGKHGVGITRATFGGDDFAADIESEAEEEDDDDVEDLIERKRKKRQAKSREKRTKKAKSDKAKAHKNDLQKNVRQTRLRSSLATASQPSAETSTGLKGSIQSNANRNTQNSCAVALFGRATSALIQGGAAKRKTSNNWRCAFLILDNADRILSWKKHGSTNPLTQIFLLPSVMGINLQFIFISRSTIFHYNPVHNAPASLLDAVHPQKIHFASYNSVEMIKSILHAPRVKSSIIGQCLTGSHVFNCTIASTLRSKLNDLMYTLMLHSFVPSLKSSTQDMTEIMRLARLLWPEYVSPLDKSNSCNDPSLKTLVWRILYCLRRDTAPSKEHCNDSNCSFCQTLPSRTKNVNASKMDLNALKQQLSEKLDINIRDDMRRLLSATAMMPGRVLKKQNIEQYSKRLPYVTKFLLLAAFLCQSKRPEHDLNLFTKRNTGKSKKKGGKKSVEGLAYVSSSKELKQRQPSFPLERLFSVFQSIIGQYGQHFMTYKEPGTSAAAQLGTHHLFQNVSQLIAFGLLGNVGGVKFNEKHNHDLMDMMSAKFSCMISREEACVIASSVGFPLEKYCP